MRVYIDRRPAMRHLGDGSQHDRGRAVFLLGEFDSPLHLGWREISALDSIIDMDGGEDLRIGFGPFSRDFDFTVGHLLAPFPEDLNDVEGRAAAEAYEQHLHRADPEIAAALVRSSIHHDRMAAAGFPDKHHAIDQFNPRSHVSHPLEINQHLNILEPGCLAT